MGKTMLDEIATNRALHDAARGNRMGNVPAGKALMSAMMIERQRVNADGDVPETYGNFVRGDEKCALDAALVLQTGSVTGVTGADVQKGKYSYSYAGSSYGQFIEKKAKDSESAIIATEILEGGVGSGANKQNEQEEKPITSQEGIKSFLKKYWMWVVAIVGAVVCLVFRRK